MCARTHRLNVATFNFEWKMAPKIENDSKRRARVEESKDEESGSNDEDEARNSWFEGIQPRIGHCAPVLQNEANLIQENVAKKKHKLTFISNVKLNYNCACLAWTPPLASARVYLLVSHAFVFAWTAVWRIKKWLLFLFQILIVHVKVFVLNFI